MAENAKQIKTMWVGCALLITLLALFTFSGCTGLKNLGSRHSDNQDKARKQAFELKVDTSEKPGMVYFLLSEASKREGDIGQAMIYMNKAGLADPGSLFLKKERARLHIYRNEIPLAMEIIDVVLKEHPDNIDFLSILAQVKLIQNKDEDVPPIFEKILSVNPDDQAVYFLLGGLYSKMNNTTKAIETFLRLTEKFPESFSGHYYLGRLYTVEAKYDQAETELMEAYKLNSDLMEALYGLVQIYEIENSPNKLKGIYQTILDRDPEDIRACLALANMYHHAGDNEKALTMLDRLGKRNEDTDEILRTVARYYIKKNLHHDGLFLLSGMMRTSDRKGDFHYFMGVCYNEIKDSKSAMREFEKVSSESTYYEKSILIRAFHHMDQNENKAAIGILEKAHNLNPENTEFILYLGSFYEEEEWYQKAVDIYLRGLAIDINNTKLYFRLGVAYDKKGDRFSCIKEMKNAIRIDPEDANALNYLGYTYADLGMNLDEAEGLITRALKYKPDDGYITDSLGWVYYKKGNYDKAVTTLEKAVSLLPDDPILLEHLGDAFIKTRNNDKALEFYKRSLKNKKKDTHGLEIKIERLINKQAILTP